MSDMKNIQYILFGKKVVYKTVYIVNFLFLVKRKFMYRKKTSKIYMSSVYSGYL